MVLNRSQAFRETVIAPVVANPAYVTAHGIT
jgi:hypothetical protein